MIGRAATGGTAKGRARVGADGVSLYLCTLKCTRGSDQGYYPMENFEISDVCEL